jgi:hypothetical protein
MGGLFLRNDHFSPHIVIGDLVPQSPWGSPLCASLRREGRGQGLSPRPMGEGTGVRAYARND